MTEHKLFVFRFADIEVRESEFALSRAGEVLQVEPTAFRVLLYLLRNPGRLIPKDEIIAAVWSDTAVSDNSLTRSVATLRRLLDDSSREPRYIATVQTLGYRFLAPVEKSQADSGVDPAPWAAANALDDGTENQPVPVPVAQALIENNPATQRTKKPWRADAKTDGHKCVASGSAWPCWRYSWWAS